MKALPKKFKTALKVLSAVVVVSLVGVGYLGYANRDMFLRVESPEASPTAVVFEGELVYLPVETAGILHTSVYPFGQANFRTTPDYIDNIIAVLDDDTEVVVLASLEGRNGTWYLVEVGDTEGYIHSSVVQVNELE